MMSSKNSTSLLSIKFTNGRGIVFVYTYPISFIFTMPAVSTFIHMYSLSEDADTSTIMLFFIKPRYSFKRSWLMEFDGNARPSPIFSTSPQSSRNIPTNLFTRSLLFSNTAISSSSVRIVSYLCNNNITMQSAPAVTALHNALLLAKKCLTCTRILFFTLGTFLLAVFTFIFKTRRDRPWSCCL